MFCGKCGNKTGEDDRFCKHCGAPLHPEEQFSVLSVPKPNAVEPAEALPVEYQPVEHDQETPQATHHPDAAPPAPARKPIGGWLGFFIITMCFLNPLFDFVALYNTSHGPFVILFGLIAAAIQIFIGVSLWRKTEKAMRYLGYYFFALLAWAVLELALGADFHYANPLAANANGLLKDGLRTAFFAVLWGSYFKRSVRVRETYGRNLW